MKQFTMQQSRRQRAATMVAVPRRRRKDSGEVVKEEKHTPIDITPLPFVNSQQKELEEEKEEETIFLNQEISKAFICKDEDCDRKHIHRHTTIQCSEHKMCKSLSIDQAEDFESQRPVPLPARDKKGVKEYLNRVKKEHKDPSLSPSNKIIINENALDHWFAQTFNLELENIPPFKPPRLPKEVHDQLAKYAREDNNLNKLFFEKDRQKVDFQMYQSERKELIRKLRESGIKVEEDKSDVTISQDQTPNQSKKKRFNMASFQNKVYHRNQDELFPVTYPKTMQVDSLVDSIERKEKLFKDITSKRREPLRMPQGDTESQSNQRQSILLRAQQASVLANQLKEKNKTQSQFQKLKNFSRYEPSSPKTKKRENSSSFSFMSKAEIQSTIKKYEQAKKSYLDNPKELPKVEVEAKLEEKQAIQQNLKNFTITRKSKSQGQFNRRRNIRAKELLATLSSEANPQLEKTLDYTQNEVETNKDLSFTQATQIIKPKRIAINRINNFARKKDSDHAQSEYAQTFFLGGTNFQNKNNRFSSRSNEKTTCLDSAKNSHTVSILGISNKNNQNRGLTPHEQLKRFTETTAYGQAFIESERQRQQKEEEEEMKKKKKRAKSRQNARSRKLSVLNYATAHQSETQSLFSQTNKTPIPQQPKKEEPKIEAIPIVQVGATVSSNLSREQKQDLIKTSYLLKQRTLMQKPKIGQVREQSRNDQHKRQQSEQLKYLIENFGDKPYKNIDMTLSSIEGSESQQFQRTGKVEQAMLFKINQMLSNDTNMTTLGDTEPSLILKNEQSVNSKNSNKGIENFQEATQKSFQQTQKLSQKDLLNKDLTGKSSKIDLHLKKKSSDLSRCITRNKATFRPANTDLFQPKSSAQRSSKLASSRFTGQTPKPVITQEGIKKIVFEFIENDIEEGFGVVQKHKMEIALDLQEQKLEIASLKVQLAGMDKEEFWAKKAILSMREGLISTSIDYYKQGLRNIPLSEMLTYNLAVSFEKMRKFENCLNWFHICLMINPHSVDALYGLALTCLKLEKFEKALEYIQLAIDDHPLNPEKEEGIDLNEDLSPISPNKKKQAIQKQKLKNYDHLPCIKSCIYLRSLAYKCLGRFQEAEKEYKSLRVTFKSQETRKLARCTFGLVLLPLLSNKKKIIDTITVIEELVKFYQKPEKVKTMYFESEVPILEQKLVFYKNQLLRTLPRKGLDEIMPKAELRQFQHKDITFIEEGKVAVIISGAFFINSHFDAVLEPRIECKITQGCTFGSEVLDGGLSKDTATWIESYGKSQLLLFPKEEFEHLYLESISHKTRVLIAHLESFSFFSQLSLQSQIRIIRHPDFQLKTFQNEAMILEMSKRSIMNEKYLLFYDNRPTKIQQAILAKQMVSMERYFKEGNKDSQKEGQTEFDESITSLHAIDFLKDSKKDEKEQDRSIMILNQSNEAASIVRKSNQTAKFGLRSDQSQMRQDPQEQEELVRFATGQIPKAQQISAKGDPGSFQFSLKQVQKMEKSQEVPPMSFQPMGSIKEVREDSYLWPESTVAESYQANLKKKQREKEMVEQRGIYLIDQGRAQIIGPHIEHILGKGDVFGESYLLKIAGLEYLGDIKAFGERETKAYFLPYEMLETLPKRELENVKKYIQTKSQKMGLFHMVQKKSKLEESISEF